MLYNIVSVLLCFSTALQVTHGVLGFNFTVVSGTHSVAKLQESIFAFVSRIPSYLRSSSSSSSSSSAAAAAAAAAADAAVSEEEGVSLAAHKRY